jgi:hypothetical protein
MAKSIQRSTVSSGLVIGLTSATTFCAVEGLAHTPRTRRIFAESARLNETPAQLRARIHKEFAKK